ncbi:hydantoinase/carbamoylase family amidase [Rhodobacter sphaeroides]|jgi:amidase, hydantoinase/carbamoylase family|uniref:N-carbamoyl-L-amino acid amidohydrolase n=1 Tax=Cereibacter sphaeroides (strain ATCC 17023 / DSM 158 / JCM 6121 / CCUG 31486 / LMG 2827 / NBRC 12203 / NCIMB 8253 / ATH 2.4.1.) TaxID=272943 RepID=Q3J6I8_CERS4|nr:Zn-dependent hydrolase [Cereibacter sphaeroides]ABA77596.1 N-carbamoyl-L-amino acid amidohydrolase [Cereibacter sphaeroides 2.4.1]AMJ46000.1 Zn-dependent hydrolase [Cereibacter sphaeroides]ANS32711.1 Zn-dependent hydrolase [Cereibacter sphaeroides]ATN61764.1 Zn-dependent hydrolase [Cereibacter sphaeroides]AXC59846.1 Zn-dependent hydrolase [Cereibacter sphaeroides 2.4.1]
MSETQSLSRIDADLLNALMEKVSEFGSTGDGGIDRPALTDAHRDARDWFRSELEARGYTVLVDAIGNLFGRIDLAGPEAPLVMIGSHLDSQPRGGRFDGAYGVIAALAAIETFRRDGGTPRCNYVIADWMNEEGARFQPSLLGSSVFAGLIELDWALGRRDREGRSVGEELVRTGYKGTDAAPRPDLYLELHIEGDAKMETAGARIAPFLRHWGALKVRIEVTGEQNHTGPTPMEDRKDAVLGAAYIIAEVRRLADVAEDTLFTSVARVDISPNSPNIVPGKAVLFCELRAPEPAMLDWSEASLRAALPALAAKAATRAEIVSIDRRPAGKFDPRLARLTERVADDFGLPRMQLDTIGGHDAVALNAILPSIVFAVPSVGGVIHRNDEYTSPEDLAAGGDVLTDMVRRIDRAGADLDLALGANA